jgi:hypothetical protein
VGFVDWRRFLATLADIMASRRGQLTTRRSSRNFRGKSSAAADHSTHVADSRFSFMTSKVMGVRASASTEQDGAIMRLQQQIRRLGKSSSIYLHKMMTRELGVDGVPHMTLPMQSGRTSATAEAAPADRSRSKSRSTQLLLSVAQLHRAFSAARLRLSIEETEAIHSWCTSGLYGALGADPVRVIELCTGRELHGRPF